MSRGHRATWRLETLAGLKRPGQGGRAIGPAKAEQLLALATESLAAPHAEELIVPLAELNKVASGLVLSPVPDRLAQPTSPAQLIDL